MSLDYGRITELEQKLDETHGETKRVIQDMLMLKPDSNTRRQELKGWYDKLVNDARQLHELLASEFEKSGS